MTKKSHQTFLALNWRKVIRKVGPRNFSRSPQTRR